MKKVLIYLSAAAAFAAGAFYGYGAYKKYSVVEADIEKVSVEKGDMEITFEDIGDVYPKNTVEVFSMASGQITDILAQESDIVKKGQKLAVVQPGQSSADKFMPVDVLSPMDGAVFKCDASGGYYDEPKMMKTGQRVSGSNEYNPTCIMKISDCSRMIVKLGVSEVDVMKIRKGLAVKIYIEALQNMEISGKVGLISPNARNERGGVKTFPVEIDMLQRAGALPGMTARVMAVMETKKNILKMPLSALFEEKGKNFVYFYDEKKNKAKKVDVSCGIRNEMEVQIISGLKEGDKLYTDKPLNVEKNDDKLPKSDKNVSPKKG